VVINTKVLDTKKPIKSVLTNIEWHVADFERPSYIMYMTSDFLMLVNSVISIQREPYCFNRLFVNSVKLHVLPHLVLLQF